MKEGKQYAVLTGDLMGSRRLSSTQQQTLFRSLNKLWQQFGEAHQGVVVGQLEIFRGDGWQAALDDPSLAIKAAIFIRAAVKAHNFVPKMDTRIGIGLGTVDSLNTRRLRESNGFAFQLSGQALDSMTDNKQSLAFSSEWKETQILAKLVFPLMDVAIHQWTRAESLAVVGSLLGLTQESIAAHPLAKKPDGQAPKRQTVSNALKRIGWKSHWQSVLPRIEDSLKGELL